MSEKTYREFLEVESRPYAEFRERIMRHLRRRLLHRRPAKWWRHPKSWQKLAHNPFGLRSVRSWVRSCEQLEKRLLRAVKNGKG